MISKLNVLSLGLLLIALFNAQHMEAKPHHSQADRHQHNGEGWGYSQPQRHRNGHNQFNDRSAGGSYQSGAEFGHGQGPSFEGGSSRERHFGGGYADQHGAGYGSQRHGGGFGGRPAGGFGRPGFGHQHGAEYGRHPPGAGFEGHLSGAGYRGQSSADVGDQSRNFQPRPDYAHQPYQPEFNNGQWGNPIQPRPKPDYQAPGSPIEPRPTDYSKFNFQQPGVSANPNPIQPPPGTNYPTEFQQPPSGQSGSPIQPRPQPDYQTPGNSYNPLQPRPGQGSNYPTEFQQPSHGKSGSPIEPRPTDSSQFNFQQPAESANPNPIQPLPGQSQQPGARHETDAGLQQSGNGQAGSTIQPRPGAGGAHSRLKPSGDTFSGPELESSGVVDDNIASIFNTKSFVSPHSNEGDEHHGSRDDQKVVVGGRNLFDTQQQCAAGTGMRGGRCRMGA